MGQAIKPSIIKSIFVLHLSKKPIHILMSSHKIISVHLLDWFRFLIRSVLSWNYKKCFCPAQCIKPLKRQDTPKEREYERGLLLWWIKHKHGSVWKCLLDLLTVHSECQPVKKKSFQLKGETIPQNIMRLCRLGLTNKTLQNSPSLSIEVQ